MEEDSIKDSQQLLSRIQKEGMSALEEVYRDYRVLYWQLGKNLLDLEEYQLHK